MKNFFSLEIHRTLYVASRYRSTAQCTCALSQYRTARRVQSGTSMCPFAAGSSIRYVSTAHRTANRLGPSTGQRVGWA
eukprot:3940381-Rhodomonas_salina.3